MKCVIYARYSSDGQREESIEGQLRECSEFAKRKGYTIINTYTDRALSGKRADNRPQFQQMITDSKQGGFDFIIVWKIDRFSRDKYESVIYKATLKKNNVTVISATEPIDASPEGKLMESIFEGFSEYYLADLVMKTNRGMTENTLKGKYNGGAVTFGYRIDEDKYFQYDPDKAPIVTDIFKRYADGETIKSIVAGLKEQGIKTLKGAEPTYQFINCMLNNRRYLGEYCFQNTVNTDAIPPLVEPEIFNKCQRRLAENMHKPTSFKPVEDKYLLTGKIFCGHCDSTMSGVSGTSKTSAIYRYYQCIASKKGGCKKKRVSKEFIESAVVNMAMAIFNNKFLMKQIVDNCYELQTKQNTRLPALENQLKQIIKEIDNVMNAIKAGIVTKSTKSTLENLEKEQEILEIAIAKEKIERPLISKEQIMFWLNRFAKTDITDMEQKQRLIDVFVNSVYVYDDKMIATFNYKDGDMLVTFDEINKALAEKKKNPGNLNDYQGSSLSAFGEPPGNRTPDHMIKSHVLYRLS